MKKSMKRVMAFCLALVMTVSMLPAAFAAEKATSFSDVGSWHWAYDAIKDMNARGILQGKTTPVNGVGQFAPNDQLTYVQFSVILARIMRPEEVAAAEAAANPKEPWWVPAARVYGNINVENAIKMPERMNRPITREEMLTLLWGAVTEKCGNGESAYLPYAQYYINDYWDIGFDARKAIDDCYYHGIIGGDANGNFNPSSTLTRAEGAVIAYRLINETARVDNSKMLKAPALDPKEFVNTAGAPSSINGEIGHTAGEFALERDEYVRPVYDGSETILQMCSEMTGFTAEIYGGRRVFPSGIGLNDNLVGGARFVLHEDARPGVNVYEWRKSLSSGTSENITLNVVMEMFRYLSGDPEVAYALWSWIDYINILGYANSDDFGFVDVVWESGKGGIITMNGIDIEVDSSVPGQNTYYFPKP